MTTSRASNGDLRATGFTLIEALVVLAIVGLVAGLAYPSIERSRDALALRHARAQVGAAVTAARVAALRLNEPSALTAIERGSALLVTGGVRFPLGSDGRITAITKPTQILFYPDGTAGGGRIRLDAPQGPSDFLIDAGSGTFRTAGPSDA